VTIASPTATAVDPANAPLLPSAKGRERKAKSEVLTYIALILVALIIIVPLLWMFLTSFKTDYDAIHAPASPWPDPATGDAYTTLATGDLPILRWLVNSLVAAAAQTIIIVVTASMAAYALARLDFPGKRIIFAVIIATLLVPAVIFLIPNYIIVDKFGWLDTLWAVIVPGSAGAFGVFFLRQFFISLPGEIEEAARVDGAGDLRIFWQIILPLSRPALATLAVLSFLTNWNDFIWPIYVLLSPQNLTLQPGLSVLQGTYSTHYGIVMAGAVIASVPVLILFSLAQKQIVESVASSGVKG
jgi:multiple sugar transport system permease protein